MSIDAFYPVSDTFALSVTTSSQPLSPAISPAPSAADIMQGGFEYRFTNVGTQPVFIADASPDESAPTAVYPLTGVNQNGALILPNTTVTLKLVYGTKLAVIATATGSTIYVCIGRGI